MALFREDGSMHVQRLWRSAIWFGFYALTASAACAPSDRCSGELYFDGVSCFPCPANSTYRDDSCVCDDRERYTFEAGRCVLRADASLPELEDAGPGIAACTEYCDFTGSCIGENSLAMAGLADVIAAIDADDRTACTVSCDGATDGAGDRDPVVTCVRDGREAAACEPGGDAMQELTNAFILIGTCCADAQDSELCRGICAALKANTYAADMAVFCPG